MSRPLLSGQVLVDAVGARQNELLAEIQKLRFRVADLESKLIEAGNQYGIVRRENETLKVLVHDMRRHLSPFYDRLRALFEDMDALPAEAPRPAGSQIWESWKQRLGGLPAKAIEALLLHGELSRAQLRIHCQCGTRSVTDIVYKLNQAGLINKNGGKISLKEMR